MGTYQLVQITSLKEDILVVNIFYSVGHGSVAVRMSGSQSREPWFESSCCRFEALEISFIPRCHISFSCINEYLATDRDGYLKELSSSGLFDLNLLI